MRGDCVIGVDLGGTKLLAGVVDAELRVHHRLRRSAQTPDQASLLRVIEEAVREAVAAARAEVSAVGFGIPAVLDAERRQVLFSTHLPLEGLSLRDVLSERLGLPVFVDNDADLALLAEQRFGAARGAGIALMITIGTGIGGGVMIDGRPLRGAQGAGRELGHMVLDIDGPPCQGGCPGRGCLEALVSGPAIVREAARVAGEQPHSALGAALAAERGLTGPLVTELAHDGDEVARSVLATIGRRLGAGIAGLVNIFDPDVVVIGGGVIAAGDLLLEPAREEFAARVLPPGRSHVRIVPTHFGDESGMLGAAVLAREGLAQRAAA